MFYNILVMFMLYAVLGWVWETSYVSIKLKRYVNRGFLRGPVVPIYGFGATAIMLSMTIVEPYLPASGPVRIIAAMLYIASVATSLEYLTSYLMEVAFGTRWWDYTERKFNLNGRIALLPTVFWGVGGYVLWSVINTPLTNWFYSLPSTSALWTVNLFYALLVIDATFTIIDLVSLSHMLRVLHEASSDFIEQLTRQKDIIGDNISSMITEVKDELRQTAPYQKLNDLMDLSEFIGIVKSKVQNLSDSPNKALERFTDTFARIKKFNRFYRKYPNATTRKLPLIFSALRRKK